MDQMSRFYSTKIASRRWPLQILCNILDLAAINAHTLYKAVMNSRISRREFLLHLIEQLTGTALEPEDDCNPVQKEDQESQVAAETSNPKSLKQKKCRFCNKNCTRSSCVQCKNFVCGTCSTIVCKKCHNDV